MHDESDQQRMKDDPALAAALRALPGAMPPADGWERIAMRIARRRRTRATLHIGLPAALAASVAMALTLPHWWPEHAPSSAPHVARQAVAKARAAGTDLNALRTQSQRLHAWVQTLDRNGAPLDGDALASAVALQDHIGLVDLQLSAATDPATRASLWQERNILLQRLGMLHLQPYSVAERTPATADQTTIL